tara:strand:- start:27712 stop:28134 length:423 start_codon:yes stop_codon:yes gene_type:complete
MANKTTATLNITSNIGSSPINLSCTTELNQAGTSTAIDYHTGLHRLDLETTNATEILDDANYSGAANMLYIKNLSKTLTDYLIIGDTASSNDMTAAGTIGRLYAGQFALIPYDPSNGSKHILVEQSVANMDWEFMLFHQD